MEKNLSTTYNKVTDNPEYKAVYYTLETTYYNEYGAKFVKEVSEKEYYASPEGKEELVLRRLGKRKSSRDSSEASL